MIEMTPEEVRAHRDLVKRFDTRIERVRYRWAMGDITKVKYMKTKKEIEQERTKYIQTVGVINYYGKLWRKA